MNRRGCYPKRIPVTSSLFRERSGTWANRFPLKRLREHDQIDWSRARLNGAAVASPPAGEQTGPNPTDRGKLGRRRHLVLDRREVPPALTVTGANRHDSVVFEARVDAIPSVPGRRAVRVVAPTSAMPTRDTALHVIASLCANGASSRALRAAVSRVMRDWAGIAGESSAHMPGWRLSASCACASSAISTSTWRCLASPVPSCALDSFSSVVGHAKDLVNGATQQVFARHPTGQMASPLACRRSADAMTGRRVGHAQAVLSDVSNLEPSPVDGHR